MSTATISDQLVLTTEAFLLTFNVDRAQCLPYSRFKNSTLSNLESITIINITGIGQLTDIFLSLLLKNCPKIATLICDGCNNLTDAVFQSLIEYCQDLTTISFNYCPKLTHKALQILGNSTLKLKSASFVSCNIIYIPSNFVTSIANQDGAYDLKGNPILNIDHKYLKCVNVNSIEDKIFKNVHKQDISFRINVIGNRGVGKSTFIANLLSFAKQTSKDTNSNHILHQEINSNLTIDWNITECTSQAMAYLATEECPLNLIMFDLTNPEFLHWLNLVNYKCPNSITILVGTHAEEFNDASMECELIYQKVANPKDSPIEDHLSKDKLDQILASADWTEAVDSDLDNQRNVKAICELAKSSTKIHKSVYAEMAKILDTFLQCGKEIFDNQAQPSYSVSKDYEELYEDILNLSNQYPYFRFSKLHLTLSEKYESTMKNNLLKPILKHLHLQGKLFFLDNFADPFVIFNKSWLNQCLTSNIPYDQHVDETFQRNIDELPINTGACYISYFNYDAINESNGKTYTADLPDSSGLDMENCWPTVDEAEFSTEIKYTIWNLPVIVLNPLLDKAIAQCCRLATNIILSWKEGVLLRCGHIQCLIIRKDNSKILEDKNMTLQLFAKCYDIDDKEEICQESFWNVVLDLGLCIEAVLHTSKLIVKKEVACPNCVKNTTSKMHYLGINEVKQTLASNSGKELVCQQQNKSISVRDIQYFVNGKSSFCVGHRLSYSNDTLGCTLCKRYPNSLIPVLCCQDCGRCHRCLTDFKVLMESLECKKLINRSFWSETSNIISIGSVLQACGEYACSAIGAVSLDTIYPNKFEFSVDAPLSSVFYFYFGLVSEHHDSRLPPGFTDKSIGFSLIDNKLFINAKETDYSHHDTSFQLGSHNKLSCCLDRISQTEVRVSFVVDSIIIASFVHEYHNQGYYPMIFCSHDCSRLFIHSTIPAIDQVGKRAAIPVSKRKNYVDIGVVIKDYSKLNTNYIASSIGEIVHILEKTNNDHYKAKNLSEQSGLIPIDCIKKILAIEKASLQKGDWIEFFDAADKSNAEVHILQVSAVKLQEIDVEIQVDLQKKEKRTIPIDSPNIHPLGWALSTKYEVTSPTGYVSKLTNAISDGKLYYKGQRVEIKYSSSWYKGTVLKTRYCDTFKIHYDGWQDSYDETISREVLRGRDKTAISPDTPIKVGDKVEAKWHSTWYKATILQCFEKEQAAFVRYDGYSSSWDTWFSGDSLKPLKSKDDSEERKGKPLNLIECIQAENGRPAPCYAFNEEQIRINPKNYQSCRSIQGNYSVIERLSERNLAIVLKEILDARRWQYPIMMLTLPEFTDLIQLSCPMLSQLQYCQSSVVHCLCYSPGFQRGISPALDLHFLAKEGDKLAKKINFLNPSQEDAPLLWFITTLCKTSAMDLVASTDVADALVGTSLGQNPGLSFHQIQRAIRETIDMIKAQTQFSMYCYNLLDRASRLRKEIKDSIMEIAEYSPRTADKSHSLLNKYDTGYGRIFAWISKLKKLKYLNLSNNKLTDLPDDFKDCSRNLQELNLASNYLTSLPNYIGSFISLLELDLSYNLISSLPTSLCRLTSLITLNLAGHQLKVLPSGLDQLSLLKNLNLSGMPVMEITEASVLHRNNMRVTLTKGQPNRPVNGYDNDDYIDLFQACDEDGNHVLDYLELNKLNNLLFTKIVRLNEMFDENNDNQQNAWPILGLKNLENLTLDYLPIRSIPEDFGNCLTNLKTLSLRHCLLLESLPASLGGLHLTKLEIVGTEKMRTPPPEITARGLNSVMAYLKRLSYGSSECKRTKLMMVGLGGAGKTSLSRSLRSASFSDKTTGEEAITDGIDIAIWTVETPDKQKIEYSLWDFAGQTLYYNTHQFFLSNRAVYLLVWNTRLGYEHAGLEFWLSSISCHAPEAPIFVVGTHCDKVEKSEIPKGRLQKFYPQIQGFFTVSSATGQGIQKLYGDLIAVTLKQKYMGEKIPNIWLEYENSIISCRNRSSVLSWKEITEIACNHGIFQDDEIREAVKLLTDLGSIQHFDTEMLREVVVINPQWIVDVMACVVSVHDSPIKNGRFHHSDMQKIWSKYNSNLHKWLLGLTEQFDLSFSLPNKSTNLVPCLLNDDDEETDDLDKETLEMDGMKETKMVYTFQYLPAGLFNRLQVRLCEFTEDQTISKRGSKLKKNGNFAVLKQSENNLIDLNVNGLRPENMLYLVNEVLESLTADAFHGVHFYYLVPCPHCLQNGSRDPSMFSSKRIRRAREVKAIFLQCDANFHTVSISELERILPPTSSDEFDVHLQNAMQGLDALSDSIMTDVYVSYCEDDLPAEENSNETLHVKRLMKSLEGEGYKCDARDYRENYSLENIAVGMKQSRAIIIMLSDNYERNEQCRSEFSHAYELLKKPIILAVIGKTNNWTKTNLGFLVSSMLYIDFSNMQLYNEKLDEIIDQVEKKTHKKVQHLQQTDCFISYCWKNSANACELGIQQVDGAIGKVDPRDLKDQLKAKGITCWMDIEQLGKAGLFEEISIGLRKSKLFVACVSDEYVKSNNCIMEFRFAVTTLRLPTVLAIIGTGIKWQYSEVGMLAANLPMFNLQGNDSEMSSEKLLSFIVEKISTLIKPEDNLLTTAPNIGKERKLQDRSAQFQGSANLESSREYYIKVLCEHEEGWHCPESGGTFPIPGGSSQMKLLVKNTAKHLLRVMSIMKHNNTGFNSLNQSNEDEFFDYVASAAKSSDLNIGLNFTSFISFMDELKIENIGLSRTHLPNGKVLWLCDKHKAAKHFTLDHLGSDSSNQQAKQINHVADVQQPSVTLAKPRTKFAAAAVTVAASQGLSKSSKSSVCSVM
ncbi:uncharacterized protein TRIADDRAFT_57945 [Trichoplax adhaerens]|uniref:non-specific serine/threonine protein kinase n=1 Tax=Trichoplax adhaerens TaxID=10228 RepID=B3S268_TRIAD|nr:hypothetical protein TRIADDRAFT_57945 [Trichoplax adhaerens]EDV23062.1 hypothetical protein TRIADDRAFT_57945 [Trichoplax adhaerens]|eukprot:XP_002113972.1 hypothetical protein TRIADDRAFT_57945 [Trichoplax adhaerens]